MQLPGGILDLFGDDAIWSDDHEGRSGVTLRVTGPTGRFFVKQGPTAVAEYERLTWLKRWLPVADVVAFEDDALVTADVGWPSLERSRGKAAVMGRTLRRLHDIPVAECPFDERLDVKLAQAAAAVSAGVVDESDFDGDNAGMTAAQVLDRLVAERPAREDLVVTHGDFTPENVLAPLTGDPVLIDLGALGVADRYVDLAIAVRELEERAEFLTAYGLEGLDEQRLGYYRLLDELR